MSKEYESKMLRRLDSIISILLNTNINDAKRIDKVRILKQAGLDYKEIATILGSSPNSISVMFAKINKEK